MTYKLFPEYIGIGQWGGIRVVISDYIPDDTIIMSKNFYDTLVKMSEGKVLPAQDVLAINVGRKDGDA